MSSEKINNKVSSVLFVKALYDFDSKDNSSLSFKKNDIIQVLTQLESGWWDGVCNGERGWFPSNYVSTFEENNGMLDEDDEVSFKNENYLLKKKNQNKILLKYKL